MSNVATNAIRAAVEIQTRKLDALLLFRPLPHQEDALKQFVKDHVVEALVGGGNRSGKSAFIAAFISSLLRDKPIILSDGTPLHVRPERFRGKELLVWGIGYNWAHVGETMYSLLFRAGQFDVIKDNISHEWRAYDPIVDLPRQHEKRGAPPFIPAIDIKPSSWAWESKRLRQLRSVQFKADDSRLVFYPSTGQVAQGQPVHFIWIDEDIENTDHYAEWLMRITQYSGKLAWTSWPTNVPSALMTAIQDRGMADRENEEPKTLYFEFQGKKNPYVQSAARAFALSTMSQEEQDARDSGVMNRASWLMYPRFHRDLHTALPKNEEADDALAKEIRKHNAIPQSWTRYLALDPGTTNPAVLLVAVPPPSLGNFVVPYAEIAIPRLDADQLAQKVLELCVNQIFQAFIVDGRAYRQKPMGLNFTIGDNYARAFAQRNLRCKESGSSFTPGSDVPEARIGQLQSWMAIRADGTTKLRIFNCPILCKQLEYYMKQPDALRQPTDKPAHNQKIDVATCLEYIASREPRYHFPVEAKVETPGIERWNAFVKQYSTGVKESVKCGAGVASSK